jgi:hypothetical protein
MTGQQQGSAGQVGGVAPGGAEASAGEDADEVLETDPDGRYYRYREIVGKGKFKTCCKGFDSQVRAPLLGSLNTEPISAAGQIIFVCFITSVGPA